MSVATSGVAPLGQGERVLVGGAGQAEEHTGSRGAVVGTGAAKFAEVGGGVAPTARHVSVDRAEGDEAGGTNRAEVAVVGWGPRA